MTSECVSKQHTSFCCVYNSVTSIFVVCACRNISAFTLQKSALSLIASTREHTRNRESEGSDKCASIL